MWQNECDLIDFDWFQISSFYDMSTVTCQSTFYQITAIGPFQRPLASMKIDWVNVPHRMWLQKSCCLRAMASIKQLNSIKSVILMWFLKKEFRHFFKSFFFSSLNYIESHRSLFDNFNSIQSNTFTHILQYCVHTRKVL